MLNMVPVILVDFAPVSIHVLPVLLKKCNDYLDGTIIQDLKDKALYSGKCAICHKAETCYCHISPTECVGKFPKLTHFYSIPVHLNGIQLIVKLR